MPPNIILDFSMIFGLFFPIWFRGGVGRKLKVNIFMKTLFGFLRADFFLTVPVLQIEIRLFGVFLEAIYRDITLSKGFHPLGVVSQQFTSFLMIIRNGRGQDVFRPSQSSGRR